MNKAQRLRLYRKRKRAQRKAQKASGRTEVSVLLSVEASNALDALTSTKEMGTKEAIDYALVTSVS